MTLDHCKTLRWKCLNASSGAMWRRLGDTPEVREMEIELALIFKMIFPRDELSRGL